jgi:hypothetical protein
MRRYAGLAITSHRTETPILDERQIANALIEN